MYDIINNKNKGTILALLSSALYGLVGYFGTKLINVDMDISSMCFWRFMISSIFMLIILKGKAYTSKINLSFPLYGALFYSVSAGSYFKATLYIGTGLAMVMFFCFPILIILYNFLFREVKITNRYILVLITISCGILLLIKKDNLGFDLYGVFFALVSAVAYAAYIIFSKNTSEKISAKVQTFFLSIGSMCYFALFAIINDQFRFPLNIVEWLYIIAIGVFCTALPILLLLEAIKYISSNKAGVLSVLEPVFVVIFGVMLLEEKIDMLQVLGVILILFSSLFTIKEE